MVARADILAGRAVILVNIQDTIDAQLRSIRSKLRVFSNSMKEIGGDLFRGGLAATIASAFPVKEFITFQDQMLFLQVKSQATAEQLQSLEKVIRQLGMTTSFSSQEVARGATMLAQAGFRPVAIEGSLQAVLDLARGARIELETSSTILANIMSAYRIEAAQAGQVASKLIAASRLGTLDVVDLGESLKESLTTFRQLNIPLDAALGMIAQISNMSLRATKAGTSLNAAFAQMSSKTEQLRELGVVVEQADLDNPVQFFTKLSVALSKLDRQAQVSTLQSLFAIRGGRGVGAVILQDLDELQEKINTIAKAGDEARISAMKLDSQLGGVWRRAVSSFQEMMIAIGATSEGPLASFGDRMRRIFNDVSRLSEANSKVTQTILLMGPAALTSGIAILSLTMIMGKLAMLITPIMMLNSALWGTAAAIVGVHKKVFLGGVDAISKPFIAARQAIEKHNKALEKLAQKTTKARQAAVARTAANLPFFMQPDSIWQKQIRFASLFEGVFSRIAKLWASFRAGQGSPFRVPGDNFPGRQPVGPGFSTFAFRRLGHSLNVAPGPPQLPAGYLQNFGRGLTAQVTRSFTQAASSPRLLEDRRRGLARGTTVEGRVISRSGAAAMSSWGKAGRTIRDAVDSIGRFIRMISSGTFIGFAKTLQGMGTALKGIGTGIAATFRGIMGVNWLRVIITGAKGLLNTFRVMLTVLNGIRRFIFSLSGVLLIVEGLILFGDKIPGIAQLLEGAGKAFRGLFSDIGNTLSNLGPSFSLLRRGFNDVFGGEAQRGVMRIKTALSDMGAVIRTGLHAAWLNFQKAIEPAAARIKVVFEGILGVFDAIIAVLGSNISAIFKTGAIVLKGDGTLLELIKSAFATENIKMFFDMLVAAIFEIGMQLNKMIGVIAEALNAIKMTFVALLKSLTWIKGSGAQDALDELDPRSADIRRSLEAAIANVRRSIREEMRTGVAQDPDRLERLLGIQRGFQKELNALTPLAGSISYNVEELNAALRKARDRALGAAAPTTPTSREFGPGSPEGIAAFRARENAMMAEAFDAMIAGIRRGVAAATGLEEQLPEGIRQFWRDFKEGFNARPRADLEHQQAQVDALREGIGKALVGDIASTRGNLLQKVPRLEKLQEKANQIGEEIANNTDPARQPRVLFG